MAEEREVLTLIVGKLEPLEEEQQTYECRYTILQAGLWWLEEEAELVFMGMEVWVAVVLEVLTVVGRKEEVEVLQQVDPEALQVVTQAQLEL